MLRIAYCVKETKQTKHVKIPIPILGTDSVGASDGIFPELRKVCFAPFYFVKLSTKLS